MPENFMFPRRCQRITTIDNDYDGNVCLQNLTKNDLIAKIMMNLWAKSHLARTDDANNDQLLIMQNANPFLFYSIYILSLPLPSSMFHMDEHAGFFCAGAPTNG